jgi:hypothetical protein
MSASAVEMSPTLVISRKLKSPDKIEQMTATPTPDSKIVKLERFDINVMEALASHEGISSSVKLLLKSYKAKRQNGNVVQTIYEYGKSMKSLGKGRLYPQKGLGLQMFPHDVRNALAGSLYWDIDMVNSQPVILHQLCEKNGWKCDRLKEYVLNRSQYLERIMNECNCDRDYAKTLCISLMFGGRPTTTPDFMLALADELANIGRNLVILNPEILKACSKEKNPNSSCVAHVCQDIEFKILSTLDSLLRKRGRYMDVYIHDGGLVLKEEGEFAFPTSILRELEAEIAEITGYTISLIVKPMEHTFEFKKDLVRMGSPESGCVLEKEYQERKERFEETHFYCVETETICIMKKNNELTHVGKAFSAVFAPFNFQKNVGRKIVTFDFISEWLKDPTKKVIQKLVFYPDVSRSYGDDTYNLFKGFAGMRNTEVCDTPADVVERFKILVEQNAGKNPIVTEYMLKWFALAVQKPYKIPGVALVLINKLQGTGKDTLSEFFGSKVIGNEYYKNIKNVETELFDTHSTAFDKTTFMKLEEVNGSLNRKFSDMLKGMITTPNATINPKGLKKYTTDAFPHIVMTTNNAVPVKVEPSDRRFCISYTASDYIGNTDFWIETYRLFGLEGAGSAVYKYLMSLDLSDFVVQSFPRTAYHEQLSTSEIPSEEQFMNNVAAFESKTSNELFTDYTNYCMENHLIPKSIIHFGRSLAPLIEQGILSKRSGRVTTLYSKI